MVFLLLIDATDDADRTLAIFRGVSYHVVSAGVSNDVPPLLPALCLSTSC